jgi:hypothetical protein
MSAKHSSGFYPGALPWRFSPTLHASFHKLHSADNQQVELGENINIIFRKEQLSPMSTILAKPPAFKRALSQLTPAGNDSAQGVIVWSSFFFAVLQSICTFFAAVDGLRLVIGVGSLAVSAGIGTAMDRFHQDWIRVPMMVLALLGSSLNLMILMQIRHLRNRPASRWRQRPLSPSRIRMERVQMALSLATLVLIGVEEYLHLRWCGHL